MRKFKPLTINVLNKMLTTHSFGHKLKKNKPLFVSLEFKPKPKTK